MGIHRLHGCAMSDAMLTALREFERNNGPRWKSKLIQEWSAGHDLGPELQQVRNTIGPSALYKINLNTTFRRLPPAAQPAS